MTTRALDIFKVVASAGLVVLMSISAVNAQVRPNPPSDVFIDGGTTLPSGLLFFDDFNYAVDTNPANGEANRAAFLAAGWQWAKADNFGDHAHGNLSTVTASGITGFVGSLPAPSPRALRMNSNALAEAGQTDFYLQLGNGTLDGIPGNVWFQFWLYPNRSGAEQTAWHGREKFLYVKQPAGEWFSSNPERWRWMIGTNSYEPFNASGLPAGSAYAINRDADLNVPVYSLAAPGDSGKLGQTNLSEYIAVNRWTLVKIHYDTRGPQGIYECWMRPQGGAWTKVAEWIGGVTPNFTWTIPVEQGGGHSYLRMPTTMPGNNITPTANSWLYMQDFAMATSEADLPVY